MDMFEAFKQLLDKEKITRSNWNKSDYIEYDADKGMFIIHVGDKIGVLKSPHFEAFSIEFKDEVPQVDNSKPRRLVIYNDNKNKIYTDEEETKLLGFMRWTILSYCIFGDHPCKECKIKKNYPEGMDCYDCFEGLLEDMSKVMTPKQIKKIFSAIKGE